MSEKELLKRFAIFFSEKVGPIEMDANYELIYFINDAPFTFDELYEHFKSLL